MARKVIAPPFGFTPQERERYESLVPEVPEEAAAELIREYGCADQEDDLLQEAYLGTAKGVRTFDPTKGNPHQSTERKLRQWVFFSALHAAQAILRREKRQSRIVQRMWEAITAHCQHEHRTFDIMGETTETYRAAMDEFRDRAAAAPYVGVAVLEIPTGGDDEIVERMTAAHCAVGLERALGELSERRFELLRLCFAENLSVKEAAAARGEKGYRAELVDFHRAVKIVAARIASKFNELPPFPPEARGTLLPERLDEPPTTKP